MVSKSNYLLLYKKKLLNRKVASTDIRKTKIKKAYKAKNKRIESVAKYILAYFKFIVVLFFYAQNNCAIFLCFL